MEDYKKNRRFLKSSIWQEAGHHVSDQRKGLEEPAKEKPLVDTTEFIELTKPQYFKIGNKPLKEVIQNRKSHRNFSTTPLSIEELSFLLWSTQGLRKDGDTRFRTVPSAGARHPFETYLYIREVEGLSEGFYRYLPLEHKLAFLFERTDTPLRIVDACFGQTFISNAAATFIWTAIPYRSEWRYHATSYKVIALDAGHLCQNLYLACEAINAGTCAIAAYNQDKMDMLLDVDGEEEFVIYLAPVGKLSTD